MLSVTIRIGNVFSKKVEPKDLQTEENFVLD